MQLPGRHGGLIVAVGVVAAAVLTVTLFGRPAAGAALTATSPAAGADLAAPPAAVTLTFSAALDQAHVSVSGARTAAASIDGDTVTQPLAGAGPGAHVVSYHVVTRDGAEVTGTLRFSVGGPGAAALPAAPDPAQGGHQHGGLDPLTGVVLAANLVVLLVIGGLLLAGRGRARHGTAGTGAAGPGQVAAGTKGGAPAERP
jgi:copper resistance protein C